MIKHMHMFGKSISGSAWHWMESTFWPFQPMFKNCTTELSDIQTQLNNNEMFGTGLLRLLINIKSAEKSFKTDVSSVSP